MSGRDAGARAVDRRWLFGPGIDLVFGCGLLYFAFFAAQLVAGPTLRDVFPLELFPFVALLLGAPHYGATILRVFELRDEGRHWRFFLCVSALVTAVFVAGLQVVAIGSLVVTLYLTWSPWHYSAQNFGVALLLLLRRGGAVTPWVRRCLRATFVLSYALVFLSLHGTGAATQQAAVEHYDGSVYTLLSLGIPSAIRDPLLIAVFVAQLIATAVALVALARAGTLAAASPALVLLAIQAIWFSLPASVVVFPALAAFEPFAPEHRAYAFTWVAVGHFVQYLWITTYSALDSTDRRGGLRYLLRALLVGISVWSLPALLFAPDLLGSLPYDLGLGLLAASAVNLHHFILDGVIWRLRDARVAQKLIAERPSSGQGDDRGGRPGGGRRLGGPVRALGVVGAAGVLVVSLFASLESLLGNRAGEQGDLERYAISVERRAWLGRDGPDARFLLGVAALQAGELDRAERQVERGLALRPTSDLHRLAGELAGLRGDSERAFEAYERAVVLDPTSAPALYQVGRLLAEQGRVEEAIERLEQADALWPDMPEIQSLLSSLRGAGRESE